MRIVLAATSVITLINDSIWVLNSGMVGEGLVVGVGVLEVVGLGVSVVCRVGVGCKVGVGVEVGEGVVVVVEPRFTVIECVLCE